MSSDEKLIERFSNQGGDLFFRPIRIAIAAYENWVHAPKPRNYAVEAANRLLAEPSRDYDNELYLARNVQGFSQDATFALKRNLDQLAHLAAEARALGVRVLLLDLPYADPLAETKLVKDTRALTSERTSNQTNWLDLDIAKDQLRWPDGLHMDERSAILMARAIEHALGRFAANRPPELRF